MIVDLASTTVEAARSLGGKALGLARLRRVGATIPPTLCISVSQDDVGETLSQLPRALADWSSPLPARNRWIVRSSYSEEDSVASSAAGLFQTKVIQVHDNFAANPIVRVAHGILQTLLRRGSHATVLVQPFVEGTISGVLFSTDPNVGRRGDGIVTFVEGSCASLVDGSTAPTVVPFEKKRPPAGLPPPLLQRWEELIDQCFALEHEWEIPIDCEFTVAADGVLYFLQARPIASLTALPMTAQLESVEEKVHLPAVAESHPKVQLRRLCQRSGVPISKAWIARTSAWEPLRFFRLPKATYTSVLIHPRTVDGTVRRRFSRDGYTGAAQVLADAGDHWVRYAIVAEVLRAIYTGMATRSEDTTIVEVARGHFVPKGIVDSTVYEVVGEQVHLVEQPLQRWFYEIDPVSGEAQKRACESRVALEHGQVLGISRILSRLKLESGACLEFGILDGGQAYVIDIQRGQPGQQALVNVRNVVALGEARGELVCVLAPSADGPEGHFYDFAESALQAPPEASPVVVAASRPEIGLLREFGRLAGLDKRVVGAVFEHNSPLCHLCVLLREWNIPAVVIPGFMQSDAARSQFVRVIATLEGGQVEPIAALDRDRHGLEEPRARNVI